MPRPPNEPIGLQLARTAKAVSRAFDEALDAAGGSRPMWLILLALKQRSWDTQAQLARSLDISGPTLTHHLDALERDGLVVRRRVPDNRRTQVVELTELGEGMFDRLREAAAAHDARLRSDLSASDLDLLRELLVRLHATVTEDAEPTAET